MTQFTFLANGLKKIVTAETAVQAFGLANKEFQHLPQGCWFESANHSFHWVAGNFFD